MTLFDTPKLFTFKPPVPQPPIKPPLLTIPYTCRFCKRDNIYSNEDTGSKLCMCGHLVVEETNGRLTHRYSRLTWTDKVE